MNSPDDPFLIEGPAVLNISGGRTSGYMLRRFLAANGGRLPDGVFAVFCNTGDEREETLRFVSEMERRWCPIVWLERDGGSDAGFREVEFETASRRAEPFEELIDERRFLPHHGARFCTQELKIEPVRAWMKARGFEHWTSAVGLRFDEAKRVADHRERQRQEDDFDSVYPLHRARVTKAHVAEHWGASDFDLGLNWWESNCRNCLAAETEVVTRDGIRRIGDLAGLTVELLVPKVVNGVVSEVGSFAPAPIRSFGVQRLWRIELQGHGRARKVVHATADHRWFLAPKGRRDGVPRDATLTRDLRPGDKLRNLFRCPVGESRGGSSLIAAMRGFVFGDGAVPSGERPGTVTLYGRKQDDLGAVFAACFGEPAVQERPGFVTGWQYYGVPRYWKLDLPSLKESRHYLMGWLSGWFAADGCVSEDGVCTIAAATREHLEFARSLCAVLGVHCGSIVAHDRVVKPPGGEERQHRLFSLHINRAHLTADFFRRAHHRERAAAASATKHVVRSHWTVLSVEPTDRVEEVFCATVEAVGAFGLADGMMTGNCFLKSRAILERTERDAPGTLAWGARMEEKIGATFVKGRRYLDVIGRAQRPMLPGLVLDPELEAPIACNCTDRRKPRRWRCSCGRRRGEGHTLLCAFAREESRRAA